MNINMNFQKSFKNVLLISKICGAWIHLKTSKFDLIFYLYWATINCSQIIYIMLKFQHMMEFDDVYGIVGSGYVIPIAFTGNIRNYCFFKHRKEFYELITTLDDEIFQPKDENEEKIYKKMMKFFCYYRYVLYVWSFVTMSSCQVGKVIFGIDESPDDGQEHCEAAMTTKQGLLMYLFQSITISTLFVLNFVSDLFMVGFSLFIGVQCDRICYQLENLKDKDIVDIKKLAQYYKRILGFATKHKKFFETIYFSFFFACLLSFASTMFMFSITVPLSFRYFHVLEYICALFGMLFTPCWFSGIVTNKSLKIPPAAYACAWVDAGKKFKKDLIIFVQMVQTPIEFRAWNLIPLSVDSFVAVIKTSFSYYTVLDNVIDK